METRRAETAMLWPEVEAGATVVAGSGRLAGWLRGEYGRRQLGAGRRAWDTPAIYSLRGWLEREWGGSAKTKLVLSRAQEALVWEELIGEGESGTAEMAASAWRLAQEWELELEGGDGGWSETADTAAFRAWALGLRGRGAKEGWVTSAELPTVVALGFRLGEMAPPRRIWLAGFDAFTPQQERLLRAAEEAGAEIRKHGSGREAAPVRVRVAGEVEQEVHAAAVWARERVEAGARVGVIVPELHAMREQVERIFEQALHGDRPPWGEGPRGYNLSLGPRLAEQPMVAAGFGFLRLLVESERPVEMAVVGTLLHSPYLGGGVSGAGERARWEAGLRRQGRSRVRFEFLESEAGGGVGRLLGAARGELGESRTARSHGAWGAVFARMLERLGWPGEAALRSGEFQALGRWNAALEELGGLDAVSAEGGVNAARALERLDWIARATIFQPEAEHEEAVQVMGWLEAAGLDFDQLWITGLHEGALPQAAAPHPFLPGRWQRERGMPRSTAARELEFCQVVFDRLRRSCGELTASFARTAEERPSSLLDGAEEASPLGDEPGAGRMALESVEDVRGPALDGEGRTEGGTALFAAQAACPFQSFARWRLHAVGPEAVPVGLAATTRGSLLHRTLELVFRQMPDQSQIKALTAEGLAGVVGECARVAVEGEKLLAERPALAELEIGRLTQTVVEWLAVEAARPPFTAIRWEEEREADFAGLRLKLRIDRVDRLPDGGLVLIDYKSGRVSKGGWATPRPTSPQLPLYLLTDPDSSSVAAVALAQLQRGEMSLKAAARGKGLLQRSVELEPNVGAWRAALEALAQEYVDGCAAVTPKKGVCETCNFELFCRVDGSDGAEREEGDAGGD